MLTMTVQNALQSVTFDECDGLGDLMGVVLCCDVPSFGPLTPVFFTKGDLHGEGDIDAQWKRALQRDCAGDEKIRMVDVFVKEFDLFGSYLVIFVNGACSDEFYARY